ncbi:MAG: acylphosphatase [Egibacteraceae bacterium]
MSKRVHVTVTGRVQAVGFRYSVVQQAQELGLTGWIRNRDDGDVEAEFQGSSEAVEEAVIFCRDGPRHARVRDVEVTPRELIEDEERFSVR